jgi:hypothetical protein
MLLPELPPGLLHIHKLPSPSNSPAIYHRPLRDEFESEQSTPVNEPMHLVGQQNGNNIDIDVESAASRHFPCQKKVLLIYALHI